MKKSALALAALAPTSGSALAADLLNKKAPAAPVVVSPWDYTVGGGLTSNYLFRGISQSNNGPSGNVNAELRYTIDPTWQLYVGTAASSIKLTNQATSPSVEIDAIGGVRATVFAGVGAAYFEGQPFRLYRRDTTLETPAIGFDNTTQQITYGPAQAVSGLRLVDGRASYGVSLATFALGFPVHFDWSWRTLFNKDWEDVLYAADGGSSKFRKPRFAMWIGYDF